MKLFFQEVAMAGRRPTPTALKLVTGNPGKRALNKKEPKPRVKAPTCPAHLDAKGKAIWKKLCALLKAMGVLTEADGFALERLVACYVDIQECRELIERDGRTYETIDQNSNTLIKNNPAVNQLRAADAQFKSYLVEFGLTPAARSKVTVEPPDGDKKKDPLGGYFS
jgi:P27 family predicted phage terminase small subunit